MTKPLNTQQKVLITLCVMLVATVEVLDMTIVNVVLPDMMGSLSATRDQITWVLTSYIVSSAIFMPLTGFLVKQVGRKRLLIANILGFVLASALCGMAQSLEQIILFRIIQGAFGASLVPLSQFIMNDSFEPHEQRIAMAIWGIGIMTAPVLGPTLGGYIAEYLDWRWVFYINLPICIPTCLLAYQVISETERTPQKIDWLGLCLLIIGIGCLQVFLDRGNSEGWLDSTLIVALITASIAGTVIFIWRGSKRANNIIEFDVFHDRNFCISLSLLMIYCLSLISTVSLQALMTETLMHYSPYTTGLLLAPRGIASAVAMLIAANLMPYIDSRFIMAIGIVLSIIGAVMLSHFELTSSFTSMIWPGVIQGVGLGLFFVPITTCTFSTLDKSQIANASGIFSFGRSLSSSIGISILSTVLSRKTQAFWLSLGGHLQPLQFGLQDWLLRHHMVLHDPQALPRLATDLGRHANMLAFKNCYQLSALFYLASLALVFCLAKTPRELIDAPPGAH